MLRKAKGRIDEFCLEVVCLPRIHPSGTKAGQTLFHGNETLSLLEVRKVWGSGSSRETWKEVSQRKLWKMPKHSWPLPHIFGTWEGNSDLHFKGQMKYSVTRIMWTMWEVSYTWPEACRNYVKISNYIVNRLFHTPGCESWENLEPQVRTLQTQILQL